MTTPLTIEDSTAHPGIRTILLDQPGKPVVVLEEDLIRALGDTIDALPGDTRGLVIASASQRVFVAGADLKSVQSLSDEALLAYLEFGASVFAKISRLEYPTAAAINGAALGGGLELAMHADLLIGARSQGAARDNKPYPIGLPEAGLGICPGWGGTNLLPARIFPGHAIQMTAEGKPMTSTEAAEAGLFDVIVDEPADVRTAAENAIAEQLGNSSGTDLKRDGAPLRWIGRPASASGVLTGLDATRSRLPETGPAQAVADCVNAGLTEGWDAAVDLERRRLTHLRNTPEGVAAIQAFFEKSSK